MKNIFSSAFYINFPSGLSGLIYNTLIPFLTGDPAYANLTRCPTGRYQTFDVHLS